MKKKYRIILSCIFILIIAAVCIYTLNKPVIVDIITLAYTDITDEITEQGFVEAARDYSLFPEVSGPITEIFVKKNAQIETGDPILAIDAEDFLYQKQQHELRLKSYEAQLADVATEDQNRHDEYEASIRRLEAELISIEGQMASAQAAQTERDLAATFNAQLDLLQLSKDQAQVEYQFSAEEYKKLLVLFESGGVSEHELRTAEEALKALTNLIEQLDAQINAAQTEKRENTGSVSLAKEGDSKYFEGLIAAANVQIENFKQNLNKNLTKNTTAYYQSLIDAEKSSIGNVENQIEKCTVRSPVSGIIFDLPAENSSVASVQAFAATIKVTENQNIKVYIPTRDSNTLAVGQPVTLIQKLRAGDNTFSGTISEIASWAEIRTSALGLEERRVAVTVTPDDTTPLQEGYDVDVKFTVFMQQDCLSVPLAAVFKIENQDHVLRIENGKAAAIPVITGAKTGRDIVITQGVQSGDRIIKDPNVEGLTAGKRVTIRNTAK